MASTTTYGKGLQEVRRLQSASLGQFTANTTKTVKTGISVPVGVGKMRIVSLSIVSDAVPSDSDGVLTLSVRARDVSEGAFDTLVTTQDLETLVSAADQNFALTLNAESSENELTLEAGDSIDVQLISNSAAIDTNPNLFLIVEYFFVPTNPELVFVKHASAY